MICHPALWLAGWVRQARVDAGDNPKLKATSDEKSEIAHLKKDLREAEREISFLKKTAAYFAAIKP